MTGGSFLEYRVRFFLIFLFLLGGSSGSSGSSEVVKVEGKVDDGRVLSKVV